MAEAFVGYIENVIIHLLMMQDVRVWDKAGNWSYATPDAAQVTLLVIYCIYDENFTVIIYTIVNGEWSDWSSWSRCSKSCGRPFGTRSRTRKCDNPPPECGGRTCSGHNDDNQPCNRIECAGKITLCSCTKRNF